MLNTLECPPASKSALCTLMRCHRHCPTAQPPAPPARPPARPQFCIVCAHACTRLIIGPPSACPPARPARPPGRSSALWPLTHMPSLARTPARSSALWTPGLTARSGCRAATSPPPGCSPRRGRRCCSTGRVRRGQGGREVCCAAVLCDAAALWCAALCCADALARFVPGCAGLPAVPLGLSACELARQPACLPPIAAASSPAKPPFSPPVPTRCRVATGRRPALCHKAADCSPRIGAARLTAPPPRPALPAPPRLPRPAPPRSALPCPAPCRRHPHL